MVVHGFGVRHAHLNLIPQHDPLDITYKHLAQVVDGEVKFTEKYLPEPSRQELDEQAERLRIDSVLTPMGLHDGGEAAT